MREKVDGSVGGCVGRGGGVLVGAKVGVAVIVAFILGLSGAVDGDTQADKARKMENKNITMGDFFRFIFSLFLKDSLPNLHKNFIRKALVFLLEHMFESCYNNLKQPCTRC